MYLNRKLIIVLILMLLALNGFSQNENKPIKNLPISIYAIQIQPQLFLTNSFYINDKLSLKHLNFITLDIDDIKNGFFSFSPENIKRITPNFIDSEYQEIYRNINLNKYIFKGYDLRNLPWLTN